MNDRRSLTLGVVIALVGAFFLLRRSVELSGPAPILLLVGQAAVAMRVLSQSYAEDKTHHSSDRRTHIT